MKLKIIDKLLSSQKEKKRALSQREASNQSIISKKSQEEKNGLFMKSLF